MASRLWLRVEGRRQAWQGIPRMGMPGVGGAWPTLQDTFPLSIPSSLHLLYSQHVGGVWGFLRSWLVWRTGLNPGFPSRLAALSAGPLAGFHLLAQPYVALSCHLGRRLISDCWHFCVWTDSKGSLLLRRNRPSPGGNAPLQADKCWQI